MLPRAKTHLFVPVAIILGNQELCEKKRVCTSLRSLKAIQRVKGPARRTTSPPPCQQKSTYTTRIS